MNNSRRLTLFLGDCITLIIALFVMLYIDQNGMPKTQVFFLHIGPFSIIFILWLIIFYVFDLYEISFAKASPLTFGRIGLAFVTCLTLGAILFYTVPIFGITPKLNLVIVTVIAFLLMLAWRRIFSKIFAIAFLRKIAIVCRTPETELLANEIALHPYIGTCIGFFERIEDIPRNEADMIVVAAPVSNELIVGTSLFDKELIRVREAYEEIFGRTPLTLMNNETALEILEKNKLSTSYIVWRLVEIVFALVVLIATSPILLISIIAISATDGLPFFYNQERVGKGGKIFRIHKLRTMKINAEKDGAVWAEKSDPRVTKVGKILRKLHIDEIPQMINILRGDIALVGP